MYTQNDLDEFVDLLDRINPYVDDAVLEQNAWCLYIEAEDKYEDEVIEDIEDALLRLGYSPVGDFDDIVIERVGSSQYTGFSMYKYELIF